MAIEFVDPKEAKEPEKVRRVTVKVRTVCDEAVIYLADEDGIAIMGASLLSIQSSGQFRRIGGVNPDLGFDLDEHGRIKGRED